MRAWELGERQGGTVTLRRVERPDLVAGPGQVVMKVYATGLGARDVNIMKTPWTGQKLKPWQNPPPPERIPLQDSSGTVLSVGAGVTHVEVGERVIATHYPRFLDGSWDFDTMAHDDFGDCMDGFLAEQALVPADALVRIPDYLTHEQASTLQSSGLTPWRGLVDEARTRTGETVLLLGTGNVSVFGLQIAKMLGARTVITSSDDAKLARMRELGADVTINYKHSPDWHAEVMAATDGRGADVILNSIGLAELEKCLLAAASNGRILYVGARPVQGTSAAPITLAQLPSLVARCISIKGYTVGSRRMFEEFLRACEQHRLQPCIDRVFGFDDVLDAVRYYESGAKLGKVVIRIA
ncbi:NAD(P)-dependent alcohol dehydrogenase [Hydrogenophaga sp.]|uniref:zinc-dependent alcohol dehydrogenase family protein n=1 Tax=Hydrogenophaga sp. TaxID=1904254 RepID=UPI0027221B32|nr:NAD(P)-dependent alcohol dehydrogenase [Hydrogenophaga sp.]MDO9436365.1 NAD(P)-dependent alcohol dehydrogenase [Hydrogenophaga sp.]